MVSVKFIEDLSISFPVYIKRFGAQSFTPAAEIDSTSLQEKSGRDIYGLANLM
jgi:hypothetical protein